MPLGSVFAHGAEWEKFVVAMQKGKFPKLRGDHDSKYNVTELSIVVLYFCCVSKKGKLLCRWHGFFFFHRLFTPLLNGPIMIKPNRPLTKMSPHSIQCILAVAEKPNSVMAPSLCSFYLSKILFAPMKALFARVASSMLLEGDSTGNKTFKKEKQEETENIKNIGHGEETKIVRSHLKSKNEKQWGTI